jgi:hypothetical protein
MIGYISAFTEYSTEQLRNTEIGALWRRTCKNNLRKCGESSPHGKLQQHPCRGGGGWETHPFGSEALSVCAVRETDKKDRVIHCLHHPAGILPRRALAPPVSLASGDPRHRISFAGQERVWYPLTRARLRDPMLSIAQEVGRLASPALLRRCLGVSGSRVAVAPAPV